MSPKDIRHYKFLRRAIEFKYKSPAASVFETFSYDPYIFRWASNTFYELKLFDYLDIRERAVLIRVYENLKKDPRLKFLDDPDSLKDKIEFKLPESFHAKIEFEQSKMSAQTPQTAPAGGAAAVSSTTKKAPGANVKLPRVSFGTGNVLKNLGSQSSIFLKRNVFSKVFTSQRLVTGFTTILGGIAGSILGPVGSLAGAGAGFLAPSYVKTFGARHLTGLANWGADSIVRLSSQTSRFSAGGFGGRSVMGKRVAIGAILLFFGVGALAAFAPLPGQETPPAAAAPATPLGSADNLAEALGCPTVGSITNPYGYNIPGQPNDIDYYGCGSLQSCHSGIDIAYGRGTSVSTTFEGVVTTVSSDDIKGKYVTISNSQTGYSATFEHLDSQIVSAGESVKRGQVIGTMGSTGAAGGVHLHYRLERNSKVINPFRYLGSSGLIATTSLTQSDDIGANNYQVKPESSNWGQCNEVP